MIVLITIAILAMGCSSSPGPDSISSHQAHSQGPGVPLTSCAVCHVNAVGARRPVMGANGDFGANPNIISHHVTGGPGIDPQPDQCLACHDMSMHMGGAVRLKNADTGTAIAYDPASPSTLEPFCLSCHDTDGAMSTFVTGGTPTSPFIDGSELGAPPYPYATRIAASWAKSYGHGPNGNHAPGAKLTCLGTGTPGTGCHGNNGAVNAHGSTNRVLAASGFLYDTNDPYNESDYGLCFNCHANYAGVRKEDILGVKFGGILDADYGWISRPPDASCPDPCWNPPYYLAGVVSKFSDHNLPDLPPDYLPYSGSPLNDYGWVSNANLHWFHLGWPTYFRGTASVSGIVCVNCHDVHGSNTSYGAVYDEIGYTNVFPDAINAYGRMRDEAYIYYPGPNILYNHPTYCAFNCHEQQGSTKAWYRPIAE